ncbi:glycosyltransferase family 9 protein [Sporomusa acidovorans]|uniref:Lipopolysaccharide core heptosyltransferase RfaQ n=1 Tax=Sporomusa acidovorans (strain ATCC 49682 / DSM 3132 / Mol) TaxID=1123286 RepID=A0ABZ3J121_SPOA4|nr:glycosyltransferase family 9 protein [Sporomusa acidovorans]OZC22834.1 lipopolysaccharide core heptosyltransferase RfaQ [Sporomusa acidovorans DSM 3132]SDE52414.1 lipopolysaccharide heptosyltransferase I/lipopolysaccharide heptosyltransferase II,TIGR02195 [Sporomusa acidovorans]
MSKEILIIRLSSIGDVIHCTPVAGALKKAWPDCKITWLVGEVCAELIKYNPHIDNIIMWSRERFEKHLQAFEFIKAYSMWHQLQVKLKEKVYDVVLDIQGLFITGMITRQVRAERRVGLSDARELNPLFMTETANPLGKHIIDRYLGVLTPLGITPQYRKMTLVIPETADQFARAYLESEQILSQDRFAVLVPGTTWTTKNWPPDFFAITAKLLAKDFKIVLCGGRNEVNLGREIIAKAGVSIVDAIGKTSLLQMAAVLARATVVVVGDTGPLYMAAAINTPAVAIFGPTNPETYTPPGKQYAALYSRQACSFCHKTKCPQGNYACMRAVTPAEVVDQAYRLSGD